MVEKRIERFGLTSDGHTVVIVHPANDRPLNALGHTGTVVLKIEEWVTREDALAIVRALNVTGLYALDKGMREPPDHEPSVRGAYVERRKV